VNRKTKFVVFSIVGPLLFGLLAYSVLRSASTVAIHQIAATTQQQPATIGAQVHAQQPDVARQAVEAQRARLEAKATQTRREMETARLEQQEAARKDAAWQAFFKPKKVCDNPPDSDTQVECGNAYMRAKRDFEERWERGDLR
jgi:hypothetical protein